MSFDKCQRCVAYTDGYLVPGVCVECDGGRHYEPRKAPLFVARAGRTKKEYNLGFGIGIWEQRRCDVVDAYYFSLAFLFVFWFVNIGVRVRRGEIWKGGNAWSRSPMNQRLNEKGLLHTDQRGGGANGRSRADRSEMVGAIARAWKGEEAQR